MQQNDSFIFMSPIGQIRIVSSGEFISELEFEDEEKAITHSSMDAASPVIIKAITELQAYFSGESRSFNFPVSQTGTEFQQQVWNELINIPYGKTISYLELSKRLGDPKNIRAAASANGKNKLAIVVPCHRVIGSDGGLTGYAGGLWRKQWLLEHERKFAYGEQLLFAQNID